jgi:alpha-D-xyloside xylohydrolase
MLLEFPDDPGCDTLDRQYMLGDALLVAPVFCHNNVVDYYLPRGRWTHFFTGEEREGGGWQRESYDFFSLPLWVRPNSIIPVGSNDSRPDYDFAEDATLQVYELADGQQAHAVIPSITGEIAVTFTITREEQKITVTREGALNRWQLLLVGVSAIVSAEGATVEHTSRGALLTPTGENAPVQIMLEK